MDITSRSVLKLVNSTRRNLYITSTLTAISMKRINAMVSDDAKNVLIDYKNKCGYRTLDEATDAFLIEYGRDRNANVQ